MSAKHKQTTSEAGTKKEKRAIKSCGKTGEYSIGLLNGFFGTFDSCRRNGWNVRYGCS